MAHLKDRNAFWIMVTLCIGRVVLLKKNCNCAGNETKQSCFNDLLRLLNIFIAKLILVKITLTCLQYDYDTRGNTGKQTF